MMGFFRTLFVMWLLVGLVSTGIVGVEQFEAANYENALTLFGLSFSCIFTALFLSRNY